MELEKWRCSVGHEATGSSEAGQNATPCPVCGETFNDRIHVYLTHRLHELRLCDEDGASRIFEKSE